MRFLPIPAFLRGWIPAVAVTTFSSFKSLKEHAEKYDLDDFKKVSEYPCLEKERGGLILFFQTEELQEKAKERLNACENGAELRKELRLILGYPPKAVEYMHRCPYDPSKHLTPEDHAEYAKRGWGAKIYYGGRLHDDIPDYYGGFDFVSGLDDVEENVKWLWENSAIPSGVARICIPIGYRRIKKEVRTFNGKTEKRPYWEPNMMEIIIEYGDEELLKKVNPLVKYTKELYEGKHAGKLKVAI